MFGDNPPAGHHDGGGPLLAKLERHTLPLARLDYTRVDDAGQITSQIAAPTPGARLDVIPLDPAVGPLLLRAERLRQQLVGPDLVGVSSARCAMHCSPW